MISSSPQGLVLPHQLDDWVERADGALPHLELLWTHAIDRDGGRAKPGRAWQQPRAVSGGSSTQSH